MTTTINAIFLWLASNFGAVVALLFLFNLFLIFIWWLERKDRKSAWKAHNESLKNMLGVVHDNTIVMETIKTLLIKR